MTHRCDSAYVQDGLEPYELEILLKIKINFDVFHFAMIRGEIRPYNSLASSSALIFEAASLSSTFVKLFNVF